MPDLLDNPAYDYTLQCMIRTQIYLTERQQQGINHLAHRTGRKQSEIIRQAIDEFLERAGPTDKLNRLRRAKGLWKNRKQLDLRALRGEFDRFN